MRGLREFRSAAYGLPDLLPWAALIEDGIVLTKSGGFLAGWEYRGPDLDSATPEELQAMAARLNSALKLGDGWTIHGDAIRAAARGYAPAGAFPDRTTWLIDDLRRESYEGASAGFSSRYILTVTWHPMPDAAARAANLFVEGRARGTAARQLERFRDQLREIEGRLSSLVKIERLRDARDESGALTSALLSHLEHCVSLAKLWAAVAGVVLWTVGQWTLARAATYDAQLSKTGPRSLRYRRYYPAQATPFGRMREIS